MRARGDLACYHEPFIDDYYLHRSNRVIPHHHPRKDFPVEFDQVCDLLLHQAYTSPVFFKDMSYYVVPHLFDRHDFFEAITHCFIVRRPQASISSYYELDDNINLWEIGYEAQWLHIEECRRNNLRTVVIEAEALQQNPRETVRHWWEKTGLNFIDSAFEWSSESPADWRRVAGWHRGVMSSGSIRPRSSADDELENRRFESCVSDRPDLMDYYNHHLPFYLQLINSV